MILSRISRVAGDKEVNPAGLVISELDASVGQGTVGGDGSHAVAGSSDGQVGSAGEQAVNAVCSGLAAAGLLTTCVVVDPSTADDHCGRRYGACGGSGDEA